MSIEIPDPIELGEDRAERFADEHIRGDSFRCPWCRKWKPLDTAVPASPDPYAPPMCADCVEE